MKAVDWIAGLGTILGIVPLVGIPGVIPLVMAWPVMEIIYWGRFTDAFQHIGDDAWGVAILLTILWTPALSPVWRIVGHYKPNLTFWQHAGWTCLGLWLWAIVTTIIVSRMIISPAQH